MDQDIRLVCMHDDASCEHLLEGGAENTIVRLPESVRSLSLPSHPPRVVAVYDAACASE